MFSKFFKYVVKHEKDKVSISLKHFQKKVVWRTVPEISIY